MLQGMEAYAGGQEGEMDRRQALRSIGAGAMALLVGGCNGGKAPLSDPFVDTAGHPYEWAIEEIRLAGLTAGCSTEPPMYCPDRAMTRGEAAVMLARVLRAR